MRKFTVRITSIFLLLTLIFLSAVTASAAERLRGDTDGDGGDDQRLTVYLMNDKILVQLHKTTYLPTDIQ